MDPQCGWCYGNSQNSALLYDSFKDQYDFKLLVGGMWIGENAPRGGAQFSNFIRSNGPQMEARTQMPLTNAFYNLCEDSTYTFSSIPSGCAIILAKKIASDKVFSFAKAVQKAQFHDGNRLDVIETYLPILEALKIDVDKFSNEWMSSNNQETTIQEFKQAQQYASGFPTLLQQEGEEVQVLTSGYFDFESVETYLKKLN